MKVLLLVDASGRLGTSDDGCWSLSPSLSVLVLGSAADGGFGDGWSGRGGGLGSGGGAIEGGEKSRRMIDDAVTVRGRPRRMEQTDQGVESVMCLTVGRIVKV